MVVDRLILTAAILVASSFSTWAGAKERSSCPLEGKVAPKPGLKIFDQASGGQVIATLSGVSLPIRLSGLNTQPSQHRARISTSRAGTQLRIDGWVAIDSFRFYATRDLPLAHGHVWISQSQRISLDTVSAQDFSVRHRILGSQDQVLTAKVPCDAIGLAFSQPTAVDIPKRAHTFQMKHASLDLYDRPNGQIVFTLKMHEQARKPFWSVEHQGRFVHLVSRGDITIDAWADRRDLTPLRRGEFFSQRVPVPITRSGRLLRMEDPPKPLIATKEMPIFLAPSGTGKPIGLVEIGTSFYRFETAHGWTKILPTHLGVLPPDDKGFWIQKSWLTDSLPQKPSD